jgi:hypothetical protein
MTSKNAKEKLIVFILLAIWFAFREDMMYVRG